MLDASQNFMPQDPQQKDLLADLLLKMNSTQVYSASLAQQRLWFLSQLQGRSTAYNVHLGLSLKGKLNLAALQAAFQEMVNRHDAFRTAFKLEGDKLVQLVTEAYPATIPVTDVTYAADSYDEAYHRARARAYQLAAREVEQPFGLSKVPLFRVHLYRVTPEDHIFLCTMHHIVTDAGSLQLFAKEMAQLYGAFANGMPSPLQPLPIRYGDFSEWQLEWFHTDAVEQQIAYWKNKLEGAPPLLELPTHAPRPPEQTFEGSVDIAPVQGHVVDRIKTLAARYHSTPFMMELAAFKLLLYRYSGQPDILVGVPVSGRNRIETEGLIGFFVNTLVLRDDLSGNPTFPQFVAQVRETMLGALSNVDVPFEKVVEILQPERSLSYNPIFQVMFATIKSAVRSQEFGSLKASPYVVDTEASIFDLTMTLIEGIDQRWWAQIEYNTNLFTQERVSRMLRDYTALLEGIGANPEAHILDLPIPSLPAPVDLASAQAEENPRKRREQVLPSAQVSPALVGRVAPTDAEQKFLVELWEQILGIAGIGIHDSFFHVGGHSLLAARLINQIYERTGKQLPVSAIFRAPTIAEFVPLLRENTVLQPDPILMQLHEGGGTTPFFAVVAPGAESFGLGLLARHMGNDQPMYKLQGLEPIVWGRPFRKDELTTLAKQYVAAMRSVQPHGPYCLGGMCEGVLIAQEIILTLESQGEEVGLFVIFDTWVLENSQIPALWVIDYYRQRFQIFRALPREEQRATIKKTVKRMFFKNGHSSGSGWNRAYWPGENFEPPRFHAPVLLFKRERQPYYYVRDRNMGWGARSTGGVEIHEMKCGHVEMLRQPQVGIVAQALMARLKAIQLQTAPSQTSKTETSNEGETGSHSEFSIVSGGSAELRKSV
jgi:thioesterase domain-containing protein